MEESGLFFVVVNLSCKYHASARYDDVLMLRTRIARVSPAKLEHEYEVYRDELLLASARSTLACVDGNGKVQRIPESISANV